MLYFRLILRFEFFGLLLVLDDLELYHDPVILLDQMCAINNLTCLKQESPDDRAIC